MSEAEANGATAGDWLYWPEKGLRFTRDKEHPVWVNFVVAQRDGQIIEIDLPESVIDAILRDHRAAQVLREAKAALREIADADWRIVEGSIGPLMDVGYAAAGRLASSKARATLARIAELEAGA